MHFFKLTCACALLCLSSDVLAYQSSAESRLPIVRNDVHCPKGSHPTFVHNSFTYNAPLHKFTDITKSFFNITWYGGFPATITTGTDNIPGATCWGRFADGTFNDTLTAYLVRPDALEYTYRGLAGTFQHVRFDGYVETMRFESICGGKATYIDLLAYVCSPDQTAAYNFYYMAQVTSFAHLAASIGVAVLPGDCPQQYYRESR